MTNAGSLSKIDRDDSLVLRAIRSAKHKVDHRVRSGVFGDTLERAISKLARRMKVSKNSIKRSIGKLMAEGLIKFAESRLFACHKNGRCGAYRRSLVKKGTAMRHQLALEAVRREAVDSEWDPKAPTEEEMQYAAWASQFRSIPPAGGWEGCCPQVAQTTFQTIRLRGFYLQSIHLAGVPCEGNGLTGDVATVVDSTEWCGSMMDTADLVQVLVDGERGVLV